ncbi:MAG: hypothetical protein IIX06_06535, partial [Bacteroidales bacterium]|nr:hypothetical protein [Bacteroidales bacterium]
MPKLTFETYKNNSFQKQFDKYSQENFGLREWTFRMYNQYLWTCYRKIKTSYVVEGKEGYLLFRI